jgi:histidine triad (HIT) family protein
MLSLARSPIGRLITGWFFAHMSFALPVDRLRETQTLIAFQHPRPIYPVHILLVPKKALAGLSDLTAADSQFLVDLFASVQSLVIELDLEAQGYRLIANGGRFQDVAQLHFHLVAGESLADQERISDDISDKANG